MHRAMRLRMTTFTTPLCSALRLAIDYCATLDNPLHYAAVS